MVIDPFPTATSLGIAPLDNRYAGTAVDSLWTQALELSDSLMASLGARIIAVDAGMKNASKVRAAGVKAYQASHTFVNCLKQVIAQYNVGNSTWDLLPALLLLRLRFERLPPPKVGLSRGGGWFRSLPCPVLHSYLP